MEPIGFQSLDKAKTELNAMIDEYAEEINKAYLQNDNELTVSLSVKFSPGKAAGDIVMKAGITFVESKIKHSVELLVNERQLSLFAAK